MSETPFSNVNNIHVHFMIPEDQKKYNYTMMYYGANIEGTHKSRKLQTQSVQVIKGNGQSI